MSGRIWPGALCIVVNSRAGNNGAHVTAIERIDRDLFVEPDGRQTFEPAWVVDRMLAGWNGVLGNVVAEDQLIPIIPPPASDATDDTAPCEVEPAQPHRVSA